MDPHNTELALLDRRAGVAGAEPLGVVDLGGDLATASGPAGGKLRGVAAVGDSHTGPAGGNDSFRGGFTTLGSNPGHVGVELLLRASLHIITVGRGETTRAG